MSQSSTCRAPLSCCLGQGAVEGHPEDLLLVPTAWLAAQSLAVPAGAGAGLQRVPEGQWGAQAVVTVLVVLAQLPVGEEHERSLLRWAGKPEPIQVLLRAGFLPLAAVSCPKHQAQPHPSPLSLLPGVTVFTA